MAINQCVFTDSGYECNIIKSLCVHITVLFKNPDGENTSKKICAFYLNKILLTFKDYWLCNLFCLGEIQMNVTIHRKFNLIWK